jgi:multidrug efflux system outer membrane protein
MYRAVFLRACDTGVRFACIRTATLIATIASLVGCAAGPDYQPPLTVTAPVFANAPQSARPMTSAEQVELTVFWRQFGDAVLDMLMQQAMQANLDVHIAQARLTEARAALLGSQAEAWPTIDLEALATTSLSSRPRSSAATRGERTSSIYAPSLLMNWELDLFGRVKRGSESAAATVSAQEMGIASAQVVLAGALATSYLTLRGTQQRLLVARESLANQREQLRLTEVRHAAGRGTQLDVARARNLVATTASTIPVLELQATRAVQRMATLTNQPAPRVEELVLGSRPLPSLPVTDLSHLPVGTPAALLRRRPDISIAERTLAAASADIGVAMAERFPRISLSGLLGLNANYVRDLSSGGTLAYLLGASLNWTALDFGRTASLVQSAESRWQRSLLVYEQTVLTALEETENALSGFTRNAQQAAELLAAARAAQEAADIARKRWAVGSIDQLALLDAERQVLSARDQLTLADTATATAIVEVYRALGGGWQVPGTAAAP